MVVMEQESQKREVEETNNAPIYCVNNCGFFGTAATNNLCSKCYRDFFLKQSKASAVTIVAEKKVEDTVMETTVQVVEDQEAVTALCEDGTTSEDPGKRLANRCTFCKKRVGLTGFKCRCGQTFCSVHRYSDKHNCPFDYKSTGQDAIAKANPVVKADKIEKI